MNTTDEHFLHVAIEVARQARRNGNHPFGALLVDEQGRLLLEAENTVITEKDCTGHAETNLMRKASRLYSPEFLARCTLYASTEPCAMCSAAIFWGGVGRVVFALSEASLAEFTAANPAISSLSLPSREVLARGNRQVRVEGPALETEARQVQEGFWT